MKAENTVLKNIKYTHSTANILPLPVWKKFKIFVQKHYFFLKKTQIFNVSRNFSILVAFYIKYTTFTDL